MKKILQCFGVAVFLLMSGQGRAFALEDAIIAVVNDEVITLSELREYLSSLYLRLKAQGLTEAEVNQKMAEYQNGSLNNLIEEKILVAEADRQQMVIQDRAIQAKIDDLKKNFLTDKGFFDALVADGLTLSDLKKRITDDLKIKYIIDKEVKNKIFVNPNEVTSYYEAHKENFIKPERVFLETIFIAKGSGRAAAIQKAQKALEQFKAGSDFTSVAGEFSESPSLGLVSRSALLPQLDAAAAKLKIDEISAPIETETGFFILKLTERHPPELMSLEDSKEEIARNIFQEKFKRKLATWLSKLKQKAHIEIRNE